MAERIAGTSVDIRFPVEKVRRYGAKAGMLMYIADKLPHIPQVPMIVSEIGETHESILSRADQAGIGWPRLFRSSAEAELIGFEGDFRTVRVDGFQEGHDQVKWNPSNYSMYRNEEYFSRGLKEQLDIVRYSSISLKEEFPQYSLPDEINVIVTEKAKSRFIGSYIKHPNREGIFLVTITESETIDGRNPVRSSYEINNDNEVRKLGSYLNFIPDEDAITEGLIEVANWHDQIASLPDIDPLWSYQVEFGIDPSFIFQFRPFKKLEKPSFKLKPDPDHPYEQLLPVVIGTTSEDGMILRVVDSDTAKTDEPCVYVDDMIMAWQNRRFPNLKASLLVDSHGFLQHGDVQAMRRSQVALLVPQSEYRWTKGLKSGDQVKIRSDGRRIEITPL